MNTCDIIIPTYNGREKLPFVIDALREQEIPAGWQIQIIISDDGSADSIRDIPARYAWKGLWQQPIVLEGVHRGRSHARNVAISKASGDIILLLADDILLRPGALREHLLFHGEQTENHIAALGCVVWDPRIHPTPLMDWMMHGGQQNDYDSIVGARTANAEHYFYGSFVSLKRSFLGDDRFSETFSQYGWEDLELGARLHRKGLVLHVLHNAMSLHRHRYTASAILERQLIVGSARYRVNTNGTRKAVHGLYSILGGRMINRFVMKKWGDRVNIPRLFALVTAGEYWYGVHHANKLLKSQIK